MRVGIPRETTEGERRVALVPETVGKLAAAGFELVVEQGAGTAASCPDDAYAEAGATLGDPWAADGVVKVRKPSAPELERLRTGQILIGFLEPLSDAAGIETLAARGVTAFALESVPRITRAQAMDALSSMATVAGYKAVLIAANTLPRLFPMMTTAAGTITPGRVFVIGAGVAGLQAIATARRLGAVTSAYDVRPAVKEQIHSLGARFVELPVEAQNAQDAGGYARAQDETFYQRQRELLTRVVAENDVVITTAVIPGKKSPILITAEMVKGMAPGSVIVDLAAERGGNCELTKLGETTVVSGVTIIGWFNLASTVPHDASQMYARNMVAFLTHLVKDGKARVDADDQIIRETLLTRGGEIANPRVREFFAIPALAGQKAT